MVNRTCLASLFGLFLASPALAAENDYAVSDKPVSDRVSATGGVGISTFARGSGTGAGPSIGGDVSWMFHGIHGVRVGYAYGVGIFGPEVHAVDVDYRWQWSSAPELRKLTESVGVFFGPSVGFVSYDGSNPQEHVSFGGNAGAFADLHIWVVTLGIDASYRFGFASGYGGEGFGTVGLHAGLTFDVARR